MNRLTTGINDQSKEYKHNAESIKELIENFQIQQKS